MSERKVLNKYFPPDFDPSLIPRRRGPKNSQQVVRLMAPFSMRCNTCGEYIYKGKKFNARKETVEGEDYYGIKIFRFYIKCTLCSAEITFKTDPKNTDYLAEHGASRNFEPWRDETAVEEEDRLARLEEEENNPMKALENRTQDSKREMEVLDALGDIRSRNARNERVAMGVLGGGKDILDRIARDEVEEEAERAKREEDEEDERLVREVFSRVAAGGPVAGPSGLNGGSGSGSGGDEEDGDEDESRLSPTPAQVTKIVKRKADGDEPDILDLLSENAKALLQPSAPSSSSQAMKRNGLSSAAKAVSSGPSLPGVVVKKRKADLSNSLGIKVKKKRAVAV